MFIKRELTSHQSLTRLMIAQFAFRTRQSTIIQDIKYNPITRQSIKTAIEEPNKVIIDKLKEEEALRQKFEQSILNIPSNDANPNNHIIVKIKSINQQQSILKASKLPLIVPVQPRPTKVATNYTIQKLNRKIPQGLKKVIPLVRLTIGKHILDAMNTMDSYNKKSASFIKLALNMVMHHAIQKGLDSDRLYVQAACTGKYKRFSKLRYHAKSRMGKAHRDTTQVRITLEERPTKDIFKEVLVGKTPPILADHLKRSLLQQDASYEQIRKFQNVLTAKGRQQQRLMLKRQVLKTYHEKKSQGQTLSLQYLKEQLLEEKASELASEYESRKQNKQRQSLQARQTLFKRNEETNV